MFLGNNILELYLQLIFPVKVWHLVRMASTPPISPSCSLRPSSITPLWWVGTRAPSKSPPSLTALVQLLTSSKAMARLTRPRWRLCVRDFARPAKSMPSLLTQSRITQWWACALFLNAQEAKVFRLVLAELRHPQPPTPIHIGNTTTVGIVNNTIKSQQSRSMEMRYFGY